MKKRLLPLLAALALAACSSSNDSQQPPCPDAGFLDGAVTAPLFAPDAKNPGPADVGVYGGLRKLGGGCKLKKDGEYIDFTFDVIAQKMPPGQAVPQQQFSYFIAIIDKDEAILQRQRFYVTVDFGKNDSGVNTVEHEVKMPPGAAASDRILVGFTLTPEQVAFNKAHPHDFLPAPAKPPGRP